MAKRGRLYPQPEQALPPVVMCQGSRVSYGRIKELWKEPHEAGHTRWPNCWKCNQPLGCSRCNSSNVLEVLCARCAAWGTEAAFHHHGPIINNEAQIWKRGGTRAPEAKEYPPAWFRRYEPPTQAIAAFRTPTVKGIR